jgi:hypothetical protein
MRQFGFSGRSPVFNNDRKTGCSAGLHGLPHSLQANAGIISQFRSHVYQPFVFSFLVNLLSILHHTAQTEPLTTSSNKQQINVNHLKILFERMAGSVRDVFEFSMRQLNLLTSTKLS